MHLDQQTPARRRVNQVIYARARARARGNRTASTGPIIHGRSTADRLRPAFSVHHQQHLQQQQQRTDDPIQTIQAPTTNGRIHQSPWTRPDQTGEKGQHRTPLVKGTGAAAFRSTAAGADLSRRATRREEDSSWALMMVGHVIRGASASLCALVLQKVREKVDAWIWKGFSFSSPSVDALCCLQYKCSTP